MLGKPQMEQRRVRKLTRVEHQAQSLGEQRLALSLWGGVQATKSRGVQPGPGQLCLSEEAWEAAGSIASGGGEQRPGLEVRVTGSAGARAIGPL